MCAVGAFSAYEMCFAPILPTMKRFVGFYFALNLFLW